MGTTTEKLQAALESKEAVQTALEDHGVDATGDFSTYGALIASELTNREVVEAHVANTNNPHGVTAAQVGAIPTSQKGAASGVAELDSSGKVPSSQLPAYVDDVLEYTAKSSFPSTGETGKIYVDTSTNKTYRWSGSAYVEISASLALGETSSTAYRGDRGKTAYDHSQVTSGNPHGVTKSDVGLGNVENKSSATIRGELTKTNVTDALGYTPPTQDTTYSEATQSAAGLMSADDKKQIDYGGTPIVTTAGTGAAYTATVDGITELKTGMRLTIIPHTVSTTANATLNVNSLGAKYIRQPLSTNTSATTAGASDGWIIANKPITLMYNGTYWITESTTITDANNLYGTLPITKGGTGATDAATALTNLGAVGADAVTGYVEDLTNLRYYWKFPDGTLICSRVLGYETVNFSQWAGGLYYSTLTLGTFPVAFVDVPTITVSVRSTDVVICGSCTGATKSAPGTVNVIKGNSNASEVTLHYIAIGRWK